MSLLTASARSNVSAHCDGQAASAECLQFLLLQVRSRNFEPAEDLGAYEGLRATLRGDGQRYKFILRTSGAWDSVCYCASIDTPVCTCRLPRLIMRNCSDQKIGLFCGLASSWQITKLK